MSTQGFGTRRQAGWFKRRDDARPGTPAHCDTTRSTARIPDTNYTPYTANAAQCCASSQRSDCPAVACFHAALP